jgi:hypothetical protein
LYAENPGLEIVHPFAAGIDIGNESHFVAVAPGLDPQPVREFGSWTADLIRMAGWLKSCGIKTVAMQSTGVYWFAAYDVLEQHGLEVFLVNARHTKNLPGRKTDVLTRGEAAWVYLSGDKDAVASSLQGQASGFSNCTLTGCCGTHSARPRTSGCSARSGGCGTGT